MKPNNELFPFGWCGFALEGYRFCDSTYCLFPFDSLPPLPNENFQGDFNWLPPLEPHLISIMKQYWLPPADQRLIVENLEKLTASAQVKGISLPEPFIAFMSNLEFQKYIPSCTACYFDLQDKLMPCPIYGNNFVIRFLNDQQGVFTWYLYLKPNGEHCVAVSNYWFDLLEINDRDITITNEDFSKETQNTFVCAQSFEEFLYRFWLENCIWFALTDKHRKLTEAEKTYLRFYKA